MKVALFQFATNAVGKVPAIIENMLALYLINAMEKCAGIEVLDITTPPRNGEVVSLAQVLSEKEIREAAERAGSDLSVWGELRFKPEGERVIREVEVILLAATADPDAPLENRHFYYQALEGDTGSGGLRVDIPALEDVVEEILLAITDILGIERAKLQLSKIGEGLSSSDRAVIYLIYALRISVDPESKLRLYLKAIAADPGFALAYTNAAQLLLGEGRHGEAMGLLLRAQTHMKHSELEPDILNLLGVATMHMGMWDEAVNVWSRALDIRPDHVETLCNLASAYSMREMPEEAEEYYHKALAAKDDFPLAWFALGRLQAREGRYEDAEVSVRRYIELCPGDPWAYYILGTCLAGLGKEDEAEFALAKATQLDPDGEAGTLARQELQGLKD